MNENCKEIVEKNKKIVTALFLVLGIFLVALSVYKAVEIVGILRSWQYPPTGNTITVSESAETYIKPDLILVDVSVITEKKTVSEAMSENSAKMNRAIDFVKNQGIDEKDIKTTIFNIYPRYEYIKTSEIYPYNEKRVLVGYEITQTLQVKIRDMAKIGQIIEGTTEAGANEISNLQFTVEKEKEIKKQLREEAIKKARTKAKELSSQLGVKFERIVNFSESEIVPWFSYTGKAAFAEAAAPQIETGENKIEVTVSITYEIK